MNTSNTPTEDILFMLSQQGLDYKMVNELNDEILRRFDNDMNEYRREVEDAV